MSQLNVSFHGKNQGIGYIHPLFFNGKTYQVASAWDVLILGLQSAEARCLKCLSTNIPQHIWFADSALPPPLASYEMMFAVWQVKKLIDSLDHERQPMLLVVEFASVLNLSRCHFTRIFKRSFGVSPAVFLKEWRIEKALWMVTHTHIKLTDIAVFCGFSDQAHFCRVFKQKVGMNPRFWRSARATDDSNIGIELLTKVSNNHTYAEAANTLHPMHQQQTIKATTAKYTLHNQTRRAQFDLSSRIFNSAKPSLITNAIRGL